MAYTYSYSRISHLLLSDIPLGLDSSYHFTVYFCYCYQIYTRSKWHWNWGQQFNWPIKRVLEKKSHSTLYFFDEKKNIGKPRRDNKKAHVFSSSSSGKHFFTPVRMRRSYSGMVDLWGFIWKSFLVNFELRSFFRRGSLGFQKLNSLAKKLHYEGYRSKSFQNQTREQKTSISNPETKASSVIWPQDVRIPRLFVKFKVLHPVLISLTYYEQLFYIKLFMLWLLRQKDKKADHKVLSKLSTTAFVI